MPRPVLAQDDYRKYIRDIYILYTVGSNHKELKGSLFISDMVSYIIRHGQSNEMRCILKNTCVDLFAATDLDHWWNP